MARNSNHPENRATPATVRHRAAVRMLLDNARNWLAGDVGAPDRDGVSAGRAGAPDVIRPNRRDGADAMGRVREALLIRQAALPAGDPRTADVQFELAQCLISADQFAEAEQMLLEAHRAIEESLGDDHPQTIDAARELARLYEAIGRVDGADPLRDCLPPGRNE